MGPRTDVGGRADSLGEPLYGLGVPGGGIVCMPLVVVVIRSVFVAGDGNGRVVDSIDVGLPIAIAVLGYAAMMMSAPRSGRVPSALRNPMNQFAPPFR